jgi:hypothetical protein
MTVAATASADARAAAPPLESGDMLTREEFEQIYGQHPEIKKAELIQGIVYVASPGRVPQHAEPENLLSTWLGNYALLHPGVRAANTVPSASGPWTNRSRM